MQIAADSVGKRREPHIETLRALACILLVSVHVVGDADEGLRLPTEHKLNQLIWMFQPLRMPLFAFISGLVFDAWVQNTEGLRAKLLGKAHRLLVPLLTVGTIFFVIRAQRHDTSLAEVWKVYFTAYDQFWYLPASFIVMTVAVVARFAMPWAFVAITSCWIAGVGLHLLDLRLEPDWFSITKAFYLAPFFFLGQLYRLSDFAAVATSPSTRFGLLACLSVTIACLAAMRQVQFDVPGLAFGDQGPGMLLLSLMLCTFLLVARLNMSWLARIGPYSYAIFLFHLFFTGAAREFLQRICGIADAYILFVASMLVGLVGPVLAQEALLMHPWLASALLGQRRGRREVPRAEHVGGSVSHV